MANPVQIYRKDATWRKGVLRNLVTDVIVHGKITTTEVRAKEVKRHVDKIITKAKKGTLSARRDAEAILRPAIVGKETVGKYLFTTIANKYKKRKGGYTRIIKAPSRRGDNTKMAVVELV